MSSLAKLLLSMGIYALGKLISDSYLCGYIFGGVGLFLMSLVHEIYEKTEK
jgi:hypothetical protein